MKWIFLISVFLLLINSVSYAQSITKENLPEFCVSVANYGNETNNLVQEADETEESQTTWFVRSLMVDFNTELREFTVYCDLLDLIKVSELNNYLERVDRKFIDYKNMNDQLLEQIIPIQERFENPQHGILVKKLIKIREDFYGQ